MKLNIPLVLIISIVAFLCVVSQSKFDLRDDVKPNLKIYVLDGGYMIVNDLSYFTQDDSYNGQKKIINNPVFIIEHEKGRLIWDVGLPDHLADRKPNEIDTTEWILFYVKDKLIDQIQAMKLTPDSIDYIIASHSHSDHIGNANYFKNSTWIVDERELEWAMREDANTSNYDSLLTSKKMVFKSKYDVFGDNSVVVHSMPGHTPGHMCLQVELKTQTIFLSGDLYHFYEQREFKRVPQFNYDVDMTLSSMDSFEELVKLNQGKVIIQHDNSDYEKLPRFPDFWE